MIVPSYFFIRISIMTA